MKLTYNQLFSVSKAFGALPVKAKGILIASGNIVKIANQLAVFDTAKNSIVKKYAEDPQTMNPQHPNWQDYINDMEMVLAEVVDIEGLQVIQSSNIDSDRLVEDQKQDLVLLMLLNLIE